MGSGVSGGPFDVGAHGPNAAGTRPSISANGRFVAFASAATNLDPADADTKDDVFVHDLQTGETALVSPDAAGEPTGNAHFGPDLSEDGRHIAYVALRPFAGMLYPENFKTYVAPNPLSGDE
jgi:Tol biopolymer transport system component